jgi:ABC-2 type transport system permease protein
MRALTGTWRLVRLALRRDRVLLPVWMVAIGGLTAAVVGSYQATVGDAEDRLATALFAAANPMTRVFDGPASGTDLGAMTVVEAYQVLAILTALMSAQAIVRHTRQDEETGRAELLGSAVVGRHARLTAALVVTLGANLVLGAAVAGILAAADLGSFGALTTGFAIAGIGWAFAGIASVSAQVFSTARAANAAAGAALGAAFLLRAVGDLLGHVADGGVKVVSAWPSWLSPIGWGQQVRPFYEDNWQIAGLFVGLLAVLLAVAFVLEAHRDVGPGMVGTRPGPARAPRGLRSALGLAWRLQRNIWLSWAFGIIVMTAALSSVGESAEELLTENEQFAELLARLSPDAGVIELFFTFMMAFVGIAAGGYVVQALLRMRAEEASGRLEPVLATATARRRWLGGHVLIAGVGITVTLTLAGLTGGVVYGAMTGRWSEGIADVTAAATVQVPAVLALGGFAVAAFAVVPRWSGSLSWGALAIALVMGQLGALLDLPQWVLNVSPFTHVPLVPAEPFEAAPVLILLAVAAGLTAAAFATFGRRDLAIGA